MNLVTALAARTGLSVPQLRRLIACDVSALALPDLALEGGRAIEAVRHTGPLPLRPPRGSCEPFRGAVVHLLRQTLHPEALGIVDVDLLLGLGRGMTAWLPEPSAIRQVLYDFLLVVETVGWTNPGWVERVRTFPGLAVADASAVGPAMTHDARLISTAPMEPTLALFPERSDGGPPKEKTAMTPSDSMMPSFSLSEGTKGRLTWLREETRTSLDRAVLTLIDLYITARRHNLEYGDLVAIVLLRKQCDATEVSVADLRQFLEHAAELQAQGLTVNDIGPALDIAEQFAAAGLTLDQIRAVADLMQALREAGVDLALLEQLREALDRYQALGYAPELINHLAKLKSTLEAFGLAPDRLGQHLRHLQRLNELGLDADSAETLAAALSATGVDGEQRAEILARLPEVARLQIDIVALQAHRDALRQELAQMEARLAKVRQGLSASRKLAARAAEEGRALVAALEQQDLMLENATAAGFALQHFLTASTEPSDLFWTLVEQLRELKQKYPGRSSYMEQLLTDALRDQVRHFLTQIASMAATSAPAPPSVA